MLDEQTQRLVDLANRYNDLVRRSNRLESQLVRVLQTWGRPPGESYFEDGFQQKYGCPSCCWEADNPGCFVGPISHGICTGTHGLFLPRVG